MIEAIINMFASSEVMASCQYCQMPCWNNEFESLSNELCLIECVFSVLTTPGDGVE